MQKTVFKNKQLLIINENNTGNLPIFQCNSVSIFKTIRQYSNPVNKPLLKFKISFYQAYITTKKSYYPNTICKSS